MKLYNSIKVLTGLEVGIQMVNFFLGTHDSLFENLVRRILAGSRKSVGKIEFNENGTYGIITALTIDETHKCTHDFTVTGYTNEMR